MILLEDINPIFNKNISQIITNPGHKLALFTDAAYLDSANDFIKELVPAIREEIMCNPEKW